MFITLHHFSLGTTGLNQTVFQIIYHAQSVVYCCYSLFFYPLLVYVINSKHLLNSTKNCKNEAKYPNIITLSVKCGVHGSEQPEEMHCRWLQEEQRDITHMHVCLHERSVHMHVFLMYVPAARSHPSLSQVNNATARVMTNKKVVNPYTNSKSSSQHTAV